MALPQRYLSASYRVPTRPFEVESEDGVHLHGVRLGDAPTALVFCHGFAGWHRKPILLRFQQELARHFAVYAFDFRGHGRSAGRCAFGAEEHLDVEAVVRLARRDRFERVVTFGGSMGGIAVIRHAALFGGVDGVVAVSTPARWEGHRSRPVRKLVWLTSTWPGRTVLRAGGIRVVRRFRPVEDPVDLVAKIAPTPLVLVHGRDDEFFDVEDAWTLFREAGEPKRLLLASRFGHAESGFSADLADRVAVALGEV
jgi:uncharacterized protein